MGSSNSRDEKVRYVFETTGVDQIDAAGKALASIANGSSDFAPSAQLMLDALNKLGSQLNAIDGFTKLKSEAGEVSIHLQEATKGLADLNNQFDRTDTSSRAVSSAFAKAEAEVSNLTAQHNRLTAQVTTAGGALRAQGVDTEHLDQAHRTLVGSISTVAAQSSLLANEAKRAGSETKHAGDETKESGEKAKEAGTAFGFFKEHLGEIISIAAAVELALKGIEFGKESLSGATALEAQLSRVKAAAADAQGQFGELDEAVEKAAQATNTTSQTAAVGLTALVNSGKSAKDAIAALVPTLQLAKIAGIDVGQAADLVSKNLDAFNIPASQAARVVDLLTAASHGSATALAAISNAAAELAPDARALGLDVDRTVGILGLLADKGFNAGTSVRALRTVFQELQNPTSALRGELLALGDGTGNFNNAIGFLTSGTPRATQALQTLSGPARSIVEVLGQEGPQAIAKFTSALQQQQGVAQRTAAVLDDNLKGASTRFGNSIDAIGEKLAKQVLEPFKNELNKLAEELDKFAESPDFKELEEEVGELAREGTRAIDNFLHGIDWKTFLDDAKASLSGVVDGLKQVADSAGAIASAVNKTADVVGGAYHLLGAATDKLVQGTANAADGIVTLIQKGAELSEGADAAAQHYESLHNVLESTAEAAGGQASKHYDKLKADLVDIAGGADQAAEGTKKHGAAAAEAAPKVTAHGDAAHGAAVHVDDLKIKLEPIGPVAQVAAQGSALLADRLREASNQAATLADRSGNAVSGVDAISLAMSKLGSTSQQALQQAATDAAHFFAVVDQNSDNTAKGLADRQNAFLGYAKAALAASAQLDEGTKASVQYDLESKAGVLGITEALKDLESQSSSSSAALTSDAARSADALARAASSANRLGSETQGAAKDADNASQAYDRFADKGEEGFADLTQGIANARAGYLGLSKDAAEFYDRALKGNFDLGHSDDGSGFDRVARAMSDAMAQTDAAIAAQRKQLQDEIADISGVGDAARDAFGNLNTGAANSIGSLEAMKREIEDGTLPAFNLLGKADLAPLQQALDAAIARAQQLKQAAEAAKQEFKSLAQATADALLQATGDQLAIEEERHRKVLQNLKDAAEKSGDLNSLEYRKAIQNENDLFKLNIDHIKDEQDAKDKKGKYADPASKDGSSGTAGGRVNFGGGGHGVSLVGPHRTIHITLGDSAQGDDLEGFLRELERSKGTSQ